MTDTAPTAPTPTTDSNGDAPAQEVDHAAENARLREELAKARKWEDRAKANGQAAKDLETFRQQSMTETERAVAAARAEGLAEGQRLGSSKLASAEIRAAAAGRNVDVDALLEGIDPTRFLDEDGEPDREAIAKWIDRVAPAAPAPKEEPAATGWPDLGQGVRSQQNMPLNGDPILRDLQKMVGGQ